MVRTSLAAVTAVLLVMLLSLLAGWYSVIPLGLAIWLPLVGFLAGCLVIGGLSRLRPAHVVLIALAIYVGATLVVTFIDLRWRDVVLGPIEFSAMVDAWKSLPLIVFGLIPPLQVFLGLAVLASGWAGETIVERLIFNLVASVLFALIGFILAGLASFAVRRHSVYVVTAPEVAAPEPSVETPGEPPSASVPSTPEEAVPPPPARAPPPPPTPTELPPSPAPSAQAIATLKGKATAHLKSTGQPVPAGQARCPFCHATIIPGSTYCNSCQKQIV
jgi:hypothetical protein